jgi:uncharacterized membrane protein
VEYLKVFLTSALPVIELRGGLPLGLSLGLPLWEAFLLSFLGNIVIIYPWLWFLERLEDFLAHNKVTAPVHAMMIRKVSRKRELFVKYGKYALFFFVAIPLPTTGAWTACVAARFFRIPINKAFWVIVTGVFVAGLIMILTSVFFINTFNLLK